MLTRVHVHPIIIFEILHVYIMLTLVQILALKTTICDLHINVKMEIPIYVNITQPIVFGHFSFFM
jgi:hypothetical protein